MNDDMKLTPPLISWGEEEIVNNQKWENPRGEEGEIYMKEMVPKKCTKREGGTSNHGNG